MAVVRSLSPLIRLAVPLLVACGASGARPIDPAPALTNASAEAITADAEQDLADSTPPSGLDRPQDLDDALAVLRSDRIDLFRAAIERSEAIGESAEDEDTRLRAQTMATQLRLAWGEAEIIVADILQSATTAIEAELGRVAPHRGVGQQRARLEQENAQVRAAVVDAKRLSSALRRTGSRRILDNYGNVQRYLDAFPQHYLAHRIAADFYRLVGDWGRFDEQVTTLQDLRPDSTGLKFLQGASAAMRGQRSDALRFLDQAIDDDRLFTRARVYRLLAQSDLSAIQAELRSLQEAAPHHQIVYWAAPLVEQGYVAR
ncbi:MAG: hypothetical protein AAF645_19435 [Myxococcota bacterium]